MARICIKVGYEIEEYEKEPGVWVPASTIEKTYFGDIVKNYRRWNTTQDGTNNNLFLNNRLSVVVDDFMKLNIPRIKYVLWKGIYWKVESVELSIPRIIMTLGGVWNGQKAFTA